MGISLRQLPAAQMVHRQFVLPEAPPGFRRRFHTMIKPIGAVCNLDSSYCFYLHKTELLSHGHSSRMGDPPPRPRGMVHECHQRRKGNL